MKLATTADGQQFALKIFEKTNVANSAIALKTLEQEVAVYKNLDHKYMVRLVDFKNDAKWVKSDGRVLAVAYMVLEFVQGGELFDYVSLGAFTEPVARYYFK